MKGAVEKLRHVAFAAIAQSLNQGIGLLCGVLIIRFLRPSEYAYYTVALSVLGMLTVCSDAGVNSAMMAIGGRDWGNPRWLGRVHFEAVRIRAHLAVCGALICVPILCILLARQNAGASSIALIVGAVLVLFWVNYDGQLRENILKLHQSLRTLQLIQILAATGRFGAYLLVLFYCSQAWVAIVVTALVQIGVNLSLRRKTKGLAYWPDSNDHCEEDAMIRKEYYRYVKMILPGAIYYAFSSQVTVALISIFGGTDAVAKVGVAGRLAMVCTIMSAVSNILVVPRFARIANEEVSKTKRLYFSTLSGIAISGALIVIFLFLFPRLSDIILGAAYHGMQYEVALGFLAAILNTMIGVAYALGAVRGIIVPPWLNIPTSMLWQGLCIAVSDIGTAQGALKMGIMSAVWPLFLICAYFWKKNK